MCPACLATVGLVVASATSTGGLIALALRKLPTFRGPIGYEVRDLGISASHDVASAAASTGSAAKGPTARKQTSEHASVPFYMDGSDKAAVDVEPR
jgi:hypothetical protein